MIFKKFFLIFILLFSNIAFSKECVVILHGLGRRTYSLNKIEKYLRANGFETYPIDYQSRKLGIKTICEKFIIPKINSLDHCQKLHFVSYSLGGLITRYVINVDRPKNLGRVILIATPNSGSHYASVIKDYSFIKNFFGEIIHDLSEESEIINSLPKIVDYEVGVISGNFTLNPIVSFIILDEENDGTVTIESTKIQGMKDHIVLKSSHSTIIYNEETIKQIYFFLKNGYFDRSK